MLFNSLINWAWNLLSRATKSSFAKKERFEISVDILSLLLYPVFLTRKIAQNGVCDVFTFFCHKTLYYRYFFSISKLRGKSVKTSQMAFKPTLTRWYTCYVFVLKTSHCDTFLSHFFVFVQIVRQTILKTLNFFALFCTFVTFFCTLLRFRFKSVTTFKISKIEKKEPL